ncbi:MAG TPA: hypothetical protein VJM31_04300 [Vicinamibacterales bacterium]|nr:hypothetical protein [Vicinamibacterales bacterium]
MRFVSVTVAASGLASIAALAALVAADRQLGVPVPYAVSCVVAMLNIAAAVAIALPRRVIFAPELVAKRVSPPVAGAKAPRLAHAPAAPIDEAVVWFETVVATPQEEAA